MVGIVVTIFPNFRLYRMVVFPAASNPTIKICASLWTVRLLNNFPNMDPILRTNSCNSIIIWVCNETFIDEYMFLRGLPIILV